MTLAQRSRDTATRTNRARQHRAEKRMDEIVVVADIGSVYQSLDRSGDVEMKAWFQQHYRRQTNDESRQDVAMGFATWLRTENREEVGTIGSVTDAADTLRGNNDFWLADGCGPDGRAA